MESAAQARRAGIGQFFNPEVLLDKLSQEFDRLDNQWSKTLRADVKIVINKPVISEENYLVDLHKSEQVINIFVDVLSLYFEVPLFELDGKNVVETHPVFHQLRALSTSLSLIRHTKYAENFPYSMITKGNSLNCSHKLHLRHIIGLVNLVQQNTNFALEAENNKKRRKVYSKCTTLEACQILCDNVEIRFKNQIVDKNRLNKLYRNHQHLCP